MVLWGGLREALTNIDELETRINILEKHQKANYNKNYNINLISRLFIIMGSSASKSKVKHNIIEEVEEFDDNESS